MSDRILRQAEVEHRTGLSRTSIWRRERDGDFPRRRKIGNGTVGWLESEITEWIRSRPVVAVGDGDHATDKAA